MLPGAVKAPGTKQIERAGEARPPLHGLAPHALPAEEVCRRLGATPQGLPSAEAARRLAAHGPNELVRPETVRWPRVLARQFESLLTLLLVGAAALSFLLRDPIEGAVILAIVVLSTLLGFAQELRAGRALAALRRATAPSAAVLRDGAERVVPARDLVPGDVLVLHAGDRLAADARVLEAVNLRLDESALTGESAPVDKRVEPLPDPALPVADRSSMVYAGTAVVAGRGRAVATATGRATEFGRVAGLLRAVEPARTPLQRSLDRVGRAIGAVAVALVLALTAAGVVRGTPWTEVFLFGVALAVAAVPEALAAVVSISLALGVHRMSRRNALVRRLPAVETLGCVSVICTDKTGTLTRGEMTARELYADGTTYTLTGVGYEPVGSLQAEGRAVAPPRVVTALLEAACFASDARLAPAAGGVIGDPTEAALVVAAAKLGIDKERLDRACPRCGEIPFSAERRRATTLQRTGTSVVAHTKGAPEDVLAGATHELGEAGPVRLDDAARARWRREAQRMAGNALRVLAVASRADATLETATRDMVLLGLVGMIDLPRPEARPALETCRAAGIRVVMLTGDHPDTARAIARELGLPESGRLVTGAELAAMSPDALREDIEDIDVFARVEPEHKLRVVDAWQARGRVVAMTGDGINDAPALAKADVGVAMGRSGTDVSREAAAMTLADDCFASIVGAVAEGRAIFSNIRKYLMYLLSSNAGEIGLIAATTLLGMPLPLSAVQILYVNLATDGLPALALSVDPPEPDLMRRPPRDPKHGLFTRPVVFLIAVGGLWSALANLALYRWALAAGHPVEHAMTLVFVSLVAIQLFKAYCFRSERASVFVRPFSNRWLNAAVLWEMGLLALVVELPVLERGFGTRGLTGGDLGIAALVALSVVPVLELAKWAVRRGLVGGTSSAGQM